jgi:hypothetical protein
MIYPEGNKNNVCMINWIKSSSDVFESNTNSVDPVTCKADSLPTLSIDTMVSTPVQVL